MPEIEVHSPPVPKARPRFARGRVFTPRTTELAEDRIRKAWLEAGWDLQTGALYVEVRARLARPATHFGRRGTLLPSAPRWPMVRPDLDNYAKTVLDALRSVAYRDDNQIVCAYLAKTYCEEGQDPGWVIGVFPILTRYKDNLVIAKEAIP